MAKQTSTKKYPYRKIGIILIIISVILGIVGFGLTFTASDPFAAGMVAWIPGLIALWAGLVFTWWSGKDSDGGHVGPL